MILLSLLMYSSVSVLKQLSWKKEPFHRQQQDRNAQTRRQTGRHGHHPPGGTPAPHDDDDVIVLLGRTCVRKQHELPINYQSVGINDIHRKHIVIFIGN